jgi:RNA polymerase sigma-70 factor (sigma-E family)
VDADAGLDDFVAAHGAALLRTAYLLCGDAHRAEDLVQGALEKAMRSWDKVAGADVPLAYVRRIVVREHLSWLRSRAAGERVGLTSVDAEVDGTEPDRSESVDVRDTVWRLLGALPRQQRAVLVLRLFEDLDDDEIAAALGCRPATVRAYAARALASLRTSPALADLHPRSAT